MDAVESNSETNRDLDGDKVRLSEKVYHIVKQTGTLTGTKLDLVKRLII